MTIWKTRNDVAINKKMLSSPVAIIYKTLSLIKTWRPLLKMKLTSSSFLPVGSAFGQCQLVLVSCQFLMMAATWDVQLHAGLHPIHVCLQFSQRDTGDPILAKENQKFDSIFQCES
jgi:hypothetical protein